MRKFRLSRGAPGRKGVVGVLGESTGAKLRREPRFRGDCGAQGHGRIRRGILLLGGIPFRPEEAEARGFEPQALRRREEVRQEVAGRHVALTYQDDFLLRLNL